MLSAHRQSQIDQAEAALSQRDYIGFATMVRTEQKLFREERAITEDIILQGVGDMIASFAKGEGRISSQDILEVMKSVYRNDDTLPWLERALNKGENDLVEGEYQGRAQITNIVREFLNRPVDRQNAAVDDGRLRARVGHWLDQTPMAAAFADVSANETPVRRKHVAPEYAGLLTPLSPPIR